MVSGIATSFVTFIASYYTCSLIMRSVRADEIDYADTVRRYCGNFGYYLTLCSTALLLIGVLVVYFVIQTQLLYPLVLAIVSWSTKSPNLKYYGTEPSFEHFSTSYCAIFIALILAYLCSLKDLSIFMRVGSFGVIFVLLLIFFIV